MPDDKLTEFLVQLCANTNGLLTKFLADRMAVVNAADLTPNAKKAFAKLPNQNDLRSEIQSTQVSQPNLTTPGPVKKAPSKKAVAKAAKKAATTKKSAKGAKKR